jgi:hypothetical protein
MSKKSYYEKLKDPRWQKKRLEVMEREGFACQQCHSIDKTLNVHHGFYASGYEPWEYPSKSLHCLCEECHEMRQSREHDVHLEISKLTFSELDSLMCDVMLFISEYGTEEIFSIVRREYARKAMEVSA